MWTPGEWRVRSRRSKLNSLHFGISILRSGYKAGREPVRLLHFRTGPTCQQLENSPDLPQESDPEGLQSQMRIPSTLCQPISELLEETEYLRYPHISQALPVRQGLDQLTERESHLHHDHWSSIARWAIAAALPNFRRGRSQMPEVRNLQLQRREPQMPIRQGHSHSYIHSDLEESHQVRRTRSAL